MFSLIAVGVLCFFAFNLIFFLVLMAQWRRFRDHERRALTRQFDSARWFHNNRDALERMGIKGFEREHMNEPWHEPDLPRDPNPPPRPKRNPWNLPDLPEPPQRFA